MTEDEIVEFASKLTAERLDRITDKMREAWESHQEEKRAAESALEYERLPWERKRARDTINRLCDDPDMWGNFGSPGAAKLDRLEREFAEAFAEPGFLPKELNRLRQWHNALTDIAPNYLEGSDCDLAEKIRKLLDAR